MPSKSALLVVLLVSSGLSFSCEPVLFQKVFGLPDQTEKKAPSEEQEIAYQPPPPPPSRPPQQVAKPHEKTEQPVEEKAEEEPQNQENAVWVPVDSQEIADSDPFGNEVLCSYIKECDHCRPSLEAFYQKCERLLEKPTKQKIIKNQLEQQCRSRNAKGCLVLSFAYQKSIDTNTQRWTTKDAETWLTALNYAKTGCDLGEWHSCYHASGLSQGYACYSANQGNSKENPGEKYKLSKQKDEYVDYTIGFAYRTCDLQRLEGLPANASGCVVLDQYTRRGVPCNYYN